MWMYSRFDCQSNAEDVLYDVTKMKADHQEFELKGRHQDYYPGTLSMHKDWTGGRKVRADTEGHFKVYKLRTTPEWPRNKEDTRWMPEDGVLQARSGWDDATSWISVELSIDRQMQDSIVTCWIVKLWSETEALPGRNEQITS
ncbi:MAG: hypothetical protein Q9211_001892 [Gyalolechia sp. 1 TL-2023]